MEQIFYPLLFSTIAGLSTLLGGFIAIYFGFSKDIKLAKTLSFSAGVMVGVSIFSLIKDSVDIISQNFIGSLSILMTVLCILLGILFSRLLDSIIYIDKNSKDMNLRVKAFRTGIVVMFVLAIHNFPEGIITFMTAFKDVKAGFIVMVSIILHNIPEGIAVSSPIYYATKSKKKAILYCFLGGIAEPIGAIFAIFILKDVLNSVSIAIILLVVSGMMLDISFSKILKDVKLIISRKQVYSFFVLGILFIFFVINFLV